MKWLLKRNRVVSLLITAALLCGAVPFVAHAESVIVQNNDLKEFFNEADDPEPTETEEPEEPEVAHTPEGLEEPEPQPDGGTAAEGAAASASLPEDAPVQDSALDALPPCETGAQLMELVRENEGGTVTLTGDILIGMREYVELRVEQPTTVVMGDFGISLDQWGSFEVYGPVHFVGSGTTQPLLRVESYRSYILQECSFTAEGDDAVVVSVGRYATWFYLWGSTFTVTGRNSVAIYGEDSLALGGLIARAEDSTSVAVKAKYEVVLVASDIRSAGETAVSGVGEVSLYGSVADPVPPNCVTGGAVAVWAGSSDSDSHIILEMGEELELPDFIWRIVYPGGYLEYMNIKDIIEWDEHGIDTDVPGVYTVTGTSTWPIQGLEVQNLYDVEVTVSVYDPAELFLGWASILGDNIVFQIFPERIYIGTANLWCSADGGAWKKIEIAEGASSNDRSEFFEDLVLESSMNEVSARRANFEDYVPYRLYVELETDERTMFSNYLELTLTEFSLELVTGGDRAGTDRNPDNGDGPGTGGPDPGDGDGQKNTPSSGKTNRSGSSTPDSFAPVATQAGVQAEIDPQEEQAGSEAVPAALPPAGGPGVEAAEPAPAVLNGQMFSKEELEDLIAANPVQVTFIQGGVRAVIPTSALAEHMGGRFEVALDMPTPESFVVALASGGEVLETLGTEFEVSVPYVISDGELVDDLVCTGADGAEVPARSGGAGRIAVTLRYTGTYTITGSGNREPAAVDSEPEPVLTVPPAAVDAQAAGRGAVVPAVAGGAAASVAAAAAGVIWVRRRHNSRG